MSPDELTIAILGEPDAVRFEQMNAAHAAEARRGAYAIVGDAELASDAVHLAFLEILRYLVAGHRWYDSSTSRGIVLRNTRWAARKLVRGRNRRPEAAVDSAQLPAQMGDDAARARSEARLLCEQVLLRIRPHHRRALSPLSAAASMPSQSSYSMRPRSCRRHHSTRLPARLNRIASGSMSILPVVPSSAV